MYSWNDPDDRVAIVQMNADLRHAQLDLLSAQCATDRLRLRFSVENLARYGEKDVLRKTIGAAVALGAIVGIIVMLYAYVFAHLVPHGLTFVK